MLPRHRLTGADFVPSTQAPRSELEDDVISNDGTVILDGLGEDDADFFTNLENTQHEAIEIEEDVAKNINRTRYYCCVSSMRGMATVFYRDNEEAAMITQVKDAFEALRKIPGAKVFKSSFSSSLRAYDKKTVISRLEMWCAWHSAWVYNEEPSFKWADHMFPLPPSMSRIDPDLFNISEEKPVTPALGESLFEDSVIPPIQVDSGDRIEECGSLVGALIPTDDPMQTESSASEAYATRFCESDTFSE